MTNSDFCSHLSTKAAFLSPAGDLEAVVWSSQLRPKSAAFVVKKVPSHAGIP